MANLRHDAAALAAEVRAAGGKLKGRRVWCPFHDDEHPSGELYQAEGGVWRYKCHADVCGFCGDIFDVRAKAEGRDLHEVLREASGRKPAKSRKPVHRTVAAALPDGAQVEAEYRYTNPATGKVDLLVVRLRDGDGKTFRQYRQVPAGWVAEAPRKPWPIYNRSRIRRAKRVVVVEGEKCVHALHEVGIVATTSPAGAGKAAHADWSPLAGKRVVLWPDNDDVGRKHMTEVAELLRKLDPAPKLYQVDPELFGLEAKQDVADLLAGLVCDRVRKREHIEYILAQADSLGVSRQVGKLLTAVIDGSRSALSWPWPHMSELTRALLPGTVTLLCGDPGATKSFMLLEAAAYWLHEDIPIAIFELEEDREYHLYRILAQQAGNSDLLDDGWLRAHADEAKGILAEHGEFIDQVGNCIWESPDRLLTLRDLVEWVDRRAAAGARVIAIDPLTVVATGDRSWREDLEFMVQVKVIARRSGASLVLITHPRKGSRQRGAGMGLDDLAGGAAYARLSQTVLWIQRHTEPQTVTVVDGYGEREEQINRTLHILKARNGRGQGLGIGCHFSGETLRCQEYGIIQRKERR